MSATVSKRQIEAIAAHASAARDIAAGLKSSETKTPHVDPSFELARSEAIDRAHELVTWLDDLLYVARTLGGTSAAVGDTCEGCGIPLAPSSGPGRPRKYCGKTCQSRATSRRARAK